MSCLLFNLTLQPLLNYVCQQDSGVTLPWDTSQTTKISSLAFADDVLIIVQSCTDICCFEWALELYELASNARLNKDKSQAFAFHPPTMDASSPIHGAVWDTDIPFPILGQDQSKIKHLGYLIRLDGSMPDESIAKALQAIKSKVQLLATLSSTLLG